MDKNILKFVDHIWYKGTNIRICKSHIFLAPALEHNQRSKKDKVNKTIVEIKWSHKMTFIITIVASINSPTIIFPAGVVCFNNETKIYPNG